MNYTTALVQLPLVCEPGKQKIVSPADAYNLCRDIENLAQETFFVVTLNTRNALLNRHLVSLGVVDSTLVQPREVFRAAIQDGTAAAVLLLHNHPSGETQPSTDDLRITRQLVDAGKIIGIKVLDHIIIGRAIQPMGDQPGQPAFLSLRESGLVTFE